MKILLDNNVPIGLADLIPGHEVMHARELGWQGMRNGELVTAGNDRFDFMITLDKNMEFQTSLKNLTLSVIFLDGNSGKLVHLKELLPEIGFTLKTPQPGKYIRVTKVD